MTLLVSQINNPEPDVLLAALKAAGEPTRLRLIILTSRAELTVTELTQILGQSQPRVSRHLKLLCEAGLLERFREGTWMFYRSAKHGPKAELCRGIISLISEGDWIKADLTRLNAIKKIRAQTAENYFRANASRWNEIRSMHVPELEVEKELITLLTDREIESFLDIGTGTGRILEIMGSKVIEGWGIDSSIEMLSMARAAIEKAGLNNCHVRLADMYSLPFSENSIDAITYHQVLHFADDPAGAIEEGARVLAQKGRMVIVDFSPHTIESLRNEHAHRRLGFSNEELANWIQSAGLTVNLVKHLAGNPLTVTFWVAEKKKIRMAKKS